ncbi:Znf648 [Columba guinea]|nr:Znf648 [Columba guinea]
MDANVDWDSENNICYTGEKRSNCSRKTTKLVGHTSSLQKEVDMNYSQTCSPWCNSAGPSGKQELPAEFHWEDKETAEIYYQKQGESTAGIFPPTSTNFDLQREDKNLQRCSSEQPKKPRRRPRDDNENTVLAAVFGEDREPISGEALSYRCKKCSSSFQGISELQEHKRTHLVENSYRCPICAKEFFRAANLRMHKLIHSSDRPHKCPECDKGFIRTADVWRHLRNVHKIERSMVILGNGMARNPWSVAHRNQHTVEGAQGCVFQTGLQAAVTCSIFSLMATRNVPHSAGWPGQTLHAYDRGVGCVGALSSSGGSQSALVMEKMLSRRTQALGLVHVARAKQDREKLISRWGIPSVSAGPFSSRNWKQDRIQDVSQPEQGRRIREGNNISRRVNFGNDMLDGILLGPLVQDISQKSDTMSGCQSGKRYEEELGNTGICYTNCIGGTKSKDTAVLATPAEALLPVEGVALLEMPEVSEPLTVKSCVSAALCRQAAQVTPDPQPDMLG